MTNITQVFVINSVQILP